MGMPVRVTGEIDAGRVFAWLRWVDATFSTYRPDSEISRLDRGELGDPHPLGARRCSTRCERLRVETGGLFDVRAGGRLDPSGYVKGWAVERAAAFGRGRFLIDAGGDIVAARLRGGSGSGIRTGPASSPPRSRWPTAQSPPRAPTSAGRTSSTRAPAARRPACPR